MAHVTEFGFLAEAFAKQSRVRVVVEQCVSFGASRHGSRVRRCARRAHHPFPGADRRHPSVRSSSSRPKPRSACHRPRSVRWRAPCAPAAGSARRQRTWPRYRHRAGDRGSCRTRWHPRPDHRPTVRRTSGTGDCTERCNDVPRGTMDEVSSPTGLDLPSLDGKAAPEIVPPRLRIPCWKGLGADSEEKREPASDIDTGTDDATRRDLDRVAAVRQLDRRVASSVLSADSRRRGRRKRPTGVSSSKTETGKSLRMQTSGRTPTHPRRGPARIAVNVAKLSEPLSRSARISGA